MHGGRPSRPGSRLPLLLGVAAILAGCELLTGYDLTDPRAPFDAEIVFEALPSSATAT